MHGSAIGGTIVSAGALDRLVHRQTLLTHVWPFLHLPQVSVPPQPSAVVPQFISSPAHVWGVHPLPHTLLVQVCPDGQVPEIERSAIAVRASPSSAGSSRWMARTRVEMKQYLRTIGPWRFPGRSNL